MTNLSIIKCKLSSSNPLTNMASETWLDDIKIFDGSLAEPRYIEYRFDDGIEGDHELKFILKNKSDIDTKIDDAGNILEDSLLNIENLTFDGIELGQIFYQLAEYHHNNNGHSDLVTEKFFGSMGCNGVVSLKFTTPVYLWLLENM